MQRLRRLAQQNVFFGVVWYALVRGPDYQPWHSGGKLNHPNDHLFPHLFPETVPPSGRWFGWLESCLARF